MKGSNGHSEEFLRLIEAALRGALTAQEKLRLEHLLVEDDQLAHIYLDHAQLDADLHLITCEERSLASIEEHLFGEPREREATEAAYATDVRHNAGTAPGESLPPGRPRFSTVLKRLPEAIRWQAHPRRFFAVALSLTVFLWVGICFFVAPALWNRRAAEQEQAQSKERPVVAQLAAYDGAVWADGKKGIPSIGYKFCKGDTLELREGIAQILFENKALVTLHAESVFILDTPSAGTLETGTLLAQVKVEEARGFVIDTPFATVIDLGTEFGVEVDEEAAEVEVYQGEVLMAVTQSDGRKKTVKLTAGGTAKADRSGNVTTGAGGLAIVPEMPRSASERKPAAQVQARIITDFADFTESGNLLSDGNSREQSFTPIGASVTIAHVSGSNAGQENYLSDEFSAFAIGDRVSVDWDGTGNFPEYEQFGLQMGSANSGTDQLRWLWRPTDAEDMQKLYLYNGTFVNTFAYTTAPDTLFLERTARGWKVGSITGDVETIHFNITHDADGSTLGLYSDMRSTTTPKTLRNLTICRQGAAEEAREHPGHGARPK